MGPLYAPLHCARRPHSRERARKDVQRLALVPGIGGLITLRNWISDYFVVVFRIRQLLKFHYKRANMRLPKLLVIFILGSLALFGQESPQRSVLLADIDKSANPCTDFYEYANGSWRTQNPI